MIQNFGIEFLYNERFLQVFRMKHKLSPVCKIYIFTFRRKYLTICWYDDSTNSDTVTNIEAGVIFF